MPPRPASAATPLLLGIDGRSGAVKTSLALELAALLSPHLHDSDFHLDAVYPGLDGLASTVQSLADTVAAPLAAGRPARWTQWDWTTDQPGPTEVTEPADVVILEGVGAGNRTTRPHLHALAWVELAAESRRHRALARDGETFAPHWERWAAQERAYLEHDDVAAAADLTVQAEAPGPPRPVAELARQVLWGLRTLPGWAEALSPVPGAAPRTVHRISGPLGRTSQEVFALGGGLQAARAVLLESSDHATTPRPERSAHSLMGWSLDGPETEAGAGTRSAGGSRMSHRDGVTTVQRGAVSVRRRLGVFAWLAQVWPERSVGVPEPAGGPGTAGGRRPQPPAWLGWLGYELKREVGSPERPSRTAAGPAPEALLFQPDRGAVVDEQARTVELFWTEDDDAGERWACTLLEQVGQAPAGAPSADHDSADHDSAPLPPAPRFTLRDSRADYLQSIAAAQEQIRQGTTYEVCLTTQLNAHLPPATHLDGWQTYRRLVAANAAPFTLYAAVHEPGTTPGSPALDLEVLSTSPERFLRITPDGTLITEPIKGTRPRGATAQQDRALAQELADSPKDRAENIMITDLARNDLSRHAVPGTLATPRLCAIESYPTVHQMVSTVTARLEPGVPRADALAAAFPPGSMTGAPKISTMDLLERLESGPRGLYSGVAGSFGDDGAADLSVLIRTLVVTRDADGVRLSLGVGGAITADSDPAAEWDEVRTKAHGVLRVLGADFPDNART